jgi:hypothetical protein
MKQETGKADAGCATYSRKNAQKCCFIPVYLLSIIPLTGDYTDYFYFAAGSTGECGAGEYNSSFEVKGYYTIEDNY